MEPLLATLLIVIFFVVGLLIGIGLTIFFHRRYEGGSNVAELEATRNQLSSIREELARSESTAAQLQQRMERSEQQSQNDFNVIRLLNPISEQLRTMNQRVASMEKERNEQFGSVAEQLQSTSFTQRNLLTVTTQLASSMQDNQARGTWGELQLQRVLELSGLQENVDYRTQVSISADSKTERPDVVVDLPHSRKIVIDAKTVGLVDTEEPEDLKAAAARLRVHIKQLSGKKYWESLPESTEYVVLFLPLDSQLAECLRIDPGLLDEGLKSNIIIASPSSLYGVLKTVAVTWRQQRVQENAEEILELSTQFYERISVLGRHLQSLGKSLGTSVKNYNAALRSIETRLLPTGRALSAYQLKSENNEFFELTDVIEATANSTAPELNPEETD